MKFGDILHGIIQDVDDHGCGIWPIVREGQNDGSSLNVIVPHATPGDEVDARFIKRDRGRRVTQLETVTVPGPDRIAAACPHASVCGGCLWQHLDYPAQLRLKLRMLNRAFESAQHVERIDQIQPATDIWHFRNRMDYVIGWQSEVGLKAYGTWNKYLDLQTCLILDETTPTILQCVRDLMRELALEPWDNRRHIGLMRYVVIREGKHMHERMITLVVHQADQINVKARQRIIEQLAPLCTTLFIGENPELTDISICSRLDLLHGKPLLQEEVNGLHYDIHPNSFFQTNSDMAAELQKTVLEFLELNVKKQKVLDLYCGLGFFGIACAKEGATVYGHELDAPMIELAKHNAELNQVKTSCTWGSGPVEKLDWAHLQPDAVIVDPPRSGLHPRALKTLLENPVATLVYVSCNYHAFVKELTALKTVYNVTEMRALDLFPHTPHLELVIKLTKK